MAVRYAWENYPACNLYNGAGLPASPFRTDNLPLPLDAKASLRDVPEVSSGTEE